MGVQPAVVKRDRFVVLVVGAATACGESADIEAVCCADADEARVWLESARPWSALVVDPGRRDLVEMAVRRGIPVAASPAADLPGFLRQRAIAVRPAGDLGRCGAVLSAAVAPAWAGHDAGGAIVSVCGPGGTGVSIVAMALAACLAGRLGPGIVLADLALRAGQAILHQVAPTTAGLEELVHAYCCGRLTPFEVRARALTPVGAGYRLLVGLHRPSHWTAIRPAAFDAALEGLRAAFGTVVADVTGDLEGEAETGSADIEDRNHMARQTVAASDVVVVVGAPGPTGRRALDATVEAVADHLGDASRTVQVLTGPGPSDDAIAVGRLDAGEDLERWGRPIADAVSARLGARLRPSPRPSLVVPGSIGHWHGAR
jgi:MinD-like ATPase involved in chromosome partitioning or flagellar assembly